MYFTLLAEILLGVLAVFGLYILLRSCLLTSLLRVVMEVPMGTTAAEVPVLLEHTREACLFGRLHIIALLLPEQRSDAALLAALNDREVTVYFIEEA